MIAWNLGPQARRAVAAIVPDPEVRATATSTVTLELVDARLAELAGRTGEDAARETEYLQRLRARLTRPRV